MDIPHIITDFGFPTALLLIILWGMRSVGKFLSPLVKQGFASHVELVDTLKTHTERQTVILESHTETLDAIHEIVKPGVANP